MKRIALLTIAIATAAYLLVSFVPASGHGAGKPPRSMLPKFLPDTVTGGSFGWPKKKATSTALVRFWATTQHQSCTATASFCFQTVTIIAALHFPHVPSEENNKAFGQARSFVPGTPTNIQLMIKDSTKFAATGGWGFGHFNTSDGKPGDETFMKTCFPCHAQTNNSVLVFARYAT
ncbi:MAG TPA: cytochrome P460 family protein [Candidatus Binatia bacterium]|nr:cytochrome P460 family protein [Candidatus Binatia bacterium]